MENNTNALKKTARLAGFLYLIWVFTGIYGMMYLPAQTYVKGDALATANKMLANEFLFRTGILNNVGSSIIWVYMVLILYRLFKQVDERQAKLLVALVLVQIPTVFFMEAFNIAALMIFKGDLLKTFELGQRQDVAMFFLKMSYYTTNTLEMFWGLWLFPFGYLVYHSGFIPRIFGVFLLINGVAYLLHAFTTVLLPNYQTLVFQLSVPFWILGEISITLWLLIKGVKSRYPH